MADPTCYECGADLEHKDCELKCTNTKCGKVFVSNAPVYKIHVAENQRVAENQQSLKRSKSRIFEDEPAESKVVSKKRKLK